MIPALSRQRQKELCELWANLVYRGNSRPVKATEKDPVLKQKNKQTKMAHQIKASATDFNIVFILGIHKVERGNRHSQAVL